MKEFQFYFPTDVKCGPGMAKNVGSLIRPYVIGKALVVTDAGLLSSKALDVVFDSLNSEGVDYEVFSEVEPNPTTDVLDKALDYLKLTQCDAVIGVGGGSSIDTAKGVAAMASNPGSILDYEGYNKLTKIPLPLVAIPTTAGTGSECTASTVFTNTETLFKTVIVSQYLFPSLAILDPELTINLPPSITAATGMDALTHAIESYVSKQSNDISKALAIQAIRLIGKSIRKCYFVGSDIESRGDMLLASFLAGLAFSQSKLGNVHAISHTFGGLFNIPHGIANAVLLPYVIQFNLPACPELYRDIAVALNEDVAGLDISEGAQKVVDHVVELNRALGIPDNIRALGVNLEPLSQMVKDSMRSGNVLVNPRLTNDKDVEGIITSAYEGNLFN